MTTKAVAVKKEGDKPAPYTQEQVDLIKRTVAKDATNDELKLFLIVAARSGLDPFSRQIHFVKRKGQGTFQTGIDGYRAIAERSGTLAGIDDPIYDSEEGPNPRKATVTVYRLVNGIRVPFTASARWTEYVPAQGQDFMWKKMPYLMLGKVAEALALRKAFPNDLSGLYTNEEMAQADSDQTEQPHPTKQVAPQAVSTAQPARLGAVALDLIYQLNTATTLAKAKEIADTIREAQASGAINKAEIAAIVKASKQAAQRIQEAANQPPEVNGAVENSGISEEEFEQMAKDVGFV